MCAEAGRLLFLSHRLPFPPHNGAAIRSLNVLWQLQQAYEIDVLCFDRRDVAYEIIPLEERVRALRQWVSRCEAVPIPQQNSRVRLVADHVASLLSGRPYTVFAHRSARFRQLLAEWMQGATYDLVHVDSLDLAGCLHDVPPARTICTHHNVESQLLQRRAAREGGLRGHYMALQGALVEREERRWLARFALNVAVSPEDAAALRGLAPEARVAVVPNGVDCDYFRPIDGPRHGCVFVGGTTWYPNRDALEWTVEAILPELRKQGIAEPVIWVGRISEAERARFAGVAGLQLTGYVDDIRPIAARARCFIAPIRVGGGTRLKMLDAWAMGLPVVATELAAEGLGARDGHDMLIRNEPVAFADAVGQVLGDSDLAARLAASGRQVAVTRFSWERVGADMRALYRAVASADEGPASR